MDAKTIPSCLFELYDEYCHSNMSRRDFLQRASGMAVLGGSALSMAEALLPDYAKAETVNFNDERIKATYLTYDSPGGTSGKMQGYLVVPQGQQGPFPAVLVIHENRGLNPYIKDVARRLALAGFVALAPDGLYPIGGYPGNDDDGRQMQRSLDQSALFNDLLNSAYVLKKHPESTGKLGATGFCFGGGVVNALATKMGKDLNAGVPYYGKAAILDDVPAIQAPLMIQYAEDDKWVNALKADYQAALEKHGKTFEMHVYPGTRHGFHNNSTPRFNEQQADLSWQRTLAFFDKHLRADS